MSDVQVDVGSGIWHCERDAHTFDEPLANAIVQFLKAENTNKVLDVGCGNGDYVKKLNDSGIVAHGIDGNPKTPEFNQNCFVHDILGKETCVAEWIVCLEVGEHIPPQHEGRFMEAITNGATMGIILSWFPQEGHGIGHFNPLPNEIVKAKMAERGFKSDEEAQEKLRKAATCWWFTLSLMCFRRT
jgi:SAM-dependent methyltransferase